MADVQGAKSFDFTLTNDFHNIVDQIQHVKNQRDAAVDSRPGGLKDFTLMDFNGELRADKLPPLLNSQSYYVLAYRNIFESSVLESTRMWRKKTVRCAVYLTTATLPKDETLDKLATLRSHVPRWHKEWEASKTKETITKFLAEHGKSMRQVHKVIGMGLGKFGSNSTEHGVEASYIHESAYFQHWTLLHIAEALGKIQGRKIDVFVQDPAYNNICKDLLNDLSTNIRVLEDPEGFLEMGSETFLFHCHMPFDATEIALAVAGEKGLAGLMCAPIADEDHQVKFTGAKLGSDTKPQELARLTSTRKYEWMKKCEPQRINPEHKWFGVGQSSAIYVRTQDL